MEEVVSSNLTRSTKTFQRLWGPFRTHNSVIGVHLGPKLRTPSDWPSAPFSVRWPYAIQAVSIWLHAYWRFRSSVGITDWWAIGPVLKLTRSLQPPLPRPGLVAATMHYSSRCTTPGLGCQR